MAVPTRHRIRRAKAALLVVAALALTACAQVGVPRGATSEFVVGAWSLDETFDSPEQPFVAFARGGSWSGSDGCNRVGGTWSLDADGSLRVTSGPQAGATCNGAPLPSALITTEWAEMRGDALVLHGSRTAEVTELVRSTDRLVGPQRLPIGYWAESDAAGAPFLAISSKGNFSGSDGCNTLTGPWEMTDSGDIRFPATVSTEMFCEGVDTWLGEAVLGRAVGGVMTLESADGTVLGQLTARR